MKYLLFSLLFTIQAFSTEAFSTQPFFTSTIIHYYQEIYNDTSINKGILTYKLYQQHHQWYAKETKYQDALSIVPYIKEDSIQLSQEMGDSRETIDIKLWEQQGTAPLMVMTKNYFSDNHIESSTITFLIKEHKKWHQITPLKEIRLENFLQGSMSIKDLNVLKAIGVLVFYDIQQRENALFVRLAINKKFINRVCQHDRSLQVDNREEYLYYCENLQGELKPPIHFIWNGQKQQLIENKIVNAKKLSPQPSLEELYEKIKTKRTILLKRYHHE